MAGGTGAEADGRAYLSVMANRTVLVLLAALALIPMAHGQTTVDDLINEVYGGGVERPSGYTFSHVIHYDLVQRIEAGEGRPPRRIKGNMDLYFTPGDSAYARVVETGETTLISIGDLTRGMRYSLTDLGVAKLGTEATMSDRMTDTLQVMRVSGDREIEGRMSAH